MGFLHWTLNLAALLLWAMWRAQTSQGSSGTARRSTSRQSHLGWRMGRWAFLLGLLAVLLILRAVFYQQAIPHTGWEARLSLAQFHPGDEARLSLVFPWASLELQLAFSIASFVQWLVPFGFCLVLVLAIQPATSEARLWNQRLAAQFGWLHRLPVWLLALLILALAVAAQWGLAWWFRRLDVLPAPTSDAKLVRIGCATALTGLRPVAWLAMAVLGLHLLSTYIYFGGFAFWKNIEVAGTQLLRPLRWLPLRWNRIDFAPAAGLLLAYGLTLLLTPERMNRIFHLVWR